MNDTTKKEPLTMSRPNRLELTKTVESGKVKQNFQHGRSKTVTVEVRKTRTFTSNDSGSMVELKRAAALQEQAEKALHSATETEEDTTLTSEERLSRLRALEHAKTRPASEPRLMPLPPTAPPVVEEKPVVVAPSKPAAAPAPAPTSASPSVTAAQAPIYNKKPLKEIVFKEEIAEKAARSAETQSNIVKPITSKHVVKSPVFQAEEEPRAAEPKQSKIKLRRADEERRSSGKITVTQALSMSDERVRSLASLRRQREKAKRSEHGNSSANQEKVFREVVIPEIITVQELANRMAERAVDVVKALMKMGTMVTVNQNIDADTAELIVSEFGHKMKRVSEGDVENILKQEDAQEDASLLKPRAPVVTIMGHVDHGKTSLLDALRKTDVAAGEAGGITQHIGAYQVTLGNNQKITFLDTPGHEAFTAMRARGAKVTDIVVLVVAADDGIMEQTKEAISHAKAAGVSIIVAVNKIDKPGADPSRVKNELMQYELVPEEYGGDVIVIEVSAKTGQGLDKLEESILLQAEVLELKANPDRTASGAVVEAKIDRGRGVVATLLIQKGTLRVGDIVVAGGAYGKVRAIIDDKGRTITEAPPALPVEILGLTQAPEAGDEFNVVENEKIARDITEYRQQRSRTAQAMLATKSLDSLFAASAGTKAKELPVIIKSDVQGSAEAITQSVQKFSGEEVTVRVLHSGVGAITESDVTLANATNALVIGFNVRATAQARDMAARDKVNIRYYSIIYDVVEDIKAALSGMLSPTLKENFLGYAEIREVFNLSKAGKVAGCMVTEGIVKRGAKVRLLRDNVVIHTGALKTLKRFKDDVKEVSRGMECGMAFENYDDMRVGDMIEAYEIEEVARTV
ncbi:MAG TPA: translation initiation factor IF-2 [Rickettsiales bacterium]|nr:translation initiation factor IF-2 [Rickettsiales bacterium]